MLKIQKMFQGTPLWLYLIIIAVMTAPFLALSFNMLIDLGDDNYEYLLLGQALYEGEGYVQLHQPGHPTENEKPPGYPFIIAQIMRSTHNAHPVIAIKIFNHICFWLAVLITVFIFIRYFRINRLVAALFAILMVTNTSVTLFTSMMLTHSPFILFSTLTTLCFLEYGASNKRIHIFLAILFSASALYIKFPGLPLVVAGSVWLLYRKEYKTALLYSGATGILLSPWLGPLIISNKFGYGIQYTLDKVTTSGQFDSYIIRFSHHLLAYLFQFIPHQFLSSLKVVMFAEKGTWGLNGQGIMVGSLVLFLLILEAVREFKEKKGNFVLFFLIIYFALISTAGSCYERYASYLWPWIFLLCALGLKQGFKMINLSASKQKILYGLLLILLFMNNLPAYIDRVYQMALNRDYVRLSTDDPATTPWLANHWHKSRPYKKIKAYTWCGQHLPKEAILSGDKAKLGTFYSKRSVISSLSLILRFNRVGAEIPVETASPILFEWINENRITHILIDFDMPVSYSKGLYQLIKGHPHFFKEIYRNGKTKPVIIYEIKKTP